MLVFDGFRYPTQHPLTIAAGFVLQFFGSWADRLWVAMIFASFLALVAGLYRLGRIAATPLVGAIAAALLLTDVGWLGSSSGLAMAAYLALVPTVLAYRLFTAGLRGVAPATASTLALAEPVVATGLGVVALGERLGLLGWGGAALVLAGPRVGQRLPELGVPEQRREVLEDDRHADVVDR